MAASTRIARLASLIGGELNFPQKLPQVSPAVEQPRLQEADVAPGVTHQDEWWHRLPVLTVEQHDPPPSQSLATSCQPSHEVPMTTNRLPEPSTDPGSIHYDVNLQDDELAPWGIRFCPFTAVAKFCYLFAPSHLKQALATDYFDAGKIFERDWQVFYIWSEHFVTSRPTTFVPELQVLELLREIHRRYAEIQPSISAGLREAGFVIDFDDSERPDLRPRWLGRCQSKQQYEGKLARLTMPDPVDPAGDQDRTLEAFKAKIELANDITKRKNKEAKAKKHAEQLGKRQQMVGELRAAQAYLGVGAAPDSPDIDRKHAILIAVDVEAYERTPTIITEVGVAILDTRELKGDPGRVGQDWQSSIRSRHFRIDEYKHLVNKDFVTGCPERFEFGTSEFVGKNQLLTVLEECFRLPSSTSQQPPIVLVGHAIVQDIKYLDTIGFNMLNYVDPTATLDTACMYRAHTRDPNARSLGSVLYDFDLAGFNLHNAGNDATYTLWVLMAIAVANAAESGSGAATERHVESLASRTEIAVEQAKQRVQTEAEGWEW